MDAPQASRLPRHKTLYHRRSDSYTEAVYNTRPPDSPSTSKVSFRSDSSSSIDKVSFRSDSSSSIESVEADCIASDQRHKGSADDKSEAEVSRIVNQRTEVEAKDEELCAAGVEDPDVTLTGQPGALCSSDSDDELDYQSFSQRSPRKLSRGRLVSGSKPLINVRSEPEHCDGKFMMQYVPHMVASMCAMKTDI